MTMPVPSKKVFVIVAGSSVVLITFLLLIVNSSTSTPDKKNPETSSKTSPTTYAKVPIPTSVKFPSGDLIKYNSQYIQYAKANLDAISKLRDDKGRYYGFLIKLANGTKQPPAIDNRSILGITQGRYQYYLATGNREELQTLSNDLEMYANPSLVPVLQNNLWNCKIMYAIWEDNSLPQSFRDKARQICLRGTYQVEEMTEIPSLKAEKQNKNITNIDFNNIFLNNPVPPPSDKLKNENDKMIEYAGFASDFTYKYLWDKKDNDLTNAQSLFALALKKYSLVKTLDFVHGQCVLGISAVDLYFRTENNNYLDFAKNLYDKSRLGFCLSDATCKDNLFDKATCGYFTNNLYNVTQDEKYLKTKTILIQSIVNSHFDYQGLPGNLEGDRLFYQKVIYPDLKKDIIKNIRDNGLVVGLLSQPEGKK
jgi:hypothetical protein